MRLVAAIVLAALCAAPATAQRFDFHRSPERLGSSLQGAEDGRFSWSPGEPLAALYDSTQPSSRLLLPLERPLSGADDFVLAVELEILAVDGGPDDFMQVAFGLVSTETTGLNRTGSVAPPPLWFVDDSDTHDQIELAYFPNVTPFGGPTLQPAVFGGAVGSPFDNFAANFGPSSDLGDNGPGQLREWPLGRRLRVLLVHDACAQRLTTRLFDAASGDELDAGLAPVDLRFLNATATFTVDAFAISLYRDHADFDPSTRSLFADVRFHSAEVEIGGAPAAELRPASLNPGARGGAVLRLSGGVFRWSGADRAEIVTGSGERLEVALRREGAALAARLERSVAADGPLEVAVGGCTLAVPEPRLVPGR